MMSQNSEWGRECEELTQFKLCCGVGFYTKKQEERFDANPKTMSQPPSTMMLEAVAQGDIASVYAISGPASASSARTRTATPPSQYRSRAP